MPESIPGTVPYPPTASRPDLEAFAFEVMFLSKPKSTRRPENPIIHKKSPAN
jgi:hypothetical protein